MGISVQRNDAQLEPVLGLNGHRSGTLHDHQSTVVPTGDDRRSTMLRNASHAYTQILGHIGVYHALPIPLFGHDVTLPTLAPGLTRRTHWRNPCLRGIHP